MNSKLFSRIAALVLCVVMLGTVSFAETTVGWDDNNKEQFTVNDGTGYLTMMAYTVDETFTAENIPDYSGQKIVALDQISEGKSFTTVTFNKKKIAADKKLAVVLGGKEDEPLKMLLETQDIHLVKNDTNGVESLAPANTIDITENEVVTTYTDVMVFGCSYTPTKNTVIKKVNFNLTSSKSDTPVDVAVEDKFLSLEGEGAFKFKVALIGLPEEYLDGTCTITATPSIDYEDNVEATE